MKHLPAATFALAVGTAAIYLLLTVSGLPDPVATRFYGGGKVGSLMSRTGYTFFMLAITIGLPVLIVLALGWFPVWFASRARFPNSHYWLAPAQRERTLRILRNHGCWIGALTAAFMGATHAFVLQAHRHNPPEPQFWPYSIAIIVLVLASIGWSVGLHFRFRRIPRT